MAGKSKDLNEAPAAPPPGAAVRVEFSEEVFAAICAAIARGESVKAICAKPGMPHRGTFYDWLAGSEDLQKQYVAAKDLSATAIFDEILEIADDGSNDTYVDEKGNTRVDEDVVQRSKLRIWSRMWVLAKLKPKKYGDKVDVGLSGTVQHNVTMTETRRKELLEKRKAALQAAAARN